MESPRYFLPIPYGSTAGSHTANQRSTRYPCQRDCESSVSVTDLVDSQLIPLRHAGKDEAWLHEWLMEKPERLGLGPIEIKGHELIQRSGGGRLDILGYRPDINTYYEIEVMLGEVDANHGFRVLDYWARERIEKPDSRHVAVLVAEDLQGRYRILLDTLPQFLPFIGIELKTLKLADPDVATAVITIEMAPEGAFDQPVEDDDKDRPTLVPRDADWWREQKGPDYVATVTEIHRLLDRAVGPSRLDFSLSSYVVLKKGRRSWLPMWARKEGVYVYIPDAGGSDGSTPSPWFEKVREALAPLGGAPNWSPKSGGSNPISFSLTPEMLQHPEVLGILRQAYEYA